jgi:hypothetical protein
MSETNSSEENKAPEKNMEPTNSSLNTKTKSNKFGMMVLVLILAAGITITALFLLLGGNKKDRESVKADSAVEEVELYAKNQAGIILESINFDDLNKEEPLSFINLEEIISKSEELSNNLKYTKAAEIDLAGKTTQTALKLDFNVEGNDAGNMKLDIDLYQSYDEDFDGEALSTSEMISTLQDAEKLKELLQTIFITGNIEFESEDGTMSLVSDMELTIIDGEAFMKFENIEVNSDNDTEAQAKADEIEGKVLKVNLDELFETVAETYSFTFDSSTFSAFEQYDQILSGDNIENTQLFKDLNQQLKSSLMFVDEDTLDTIRNVGNPILEVVTEKIDNTEFFVNKRDSDPIRNDANAECSTADFSFNNTLDSVEEGAIEVIDILKEDKSFASSIEAMEQSQRDLPEEIDNLKEQIEDSGLAFSVRLCNGQDDEGLTGVGFDLSVETAFQSVDVTMDVLTVDMDSDFEIEEPEQIDQDFTEQFNKLFEGRVMAPSDTTLPTDLFDTRLMDDSTVEDELFNKYVNGEITYEEYLEELSRI